MSREVLVVLPHSLGRQEARRRVVHAIERAQASIGQGLVNTDVQWPREDHGAVTVRAMGQTVSAEIDVEDTQVRVRVLLPWLLGRFAEKITERIEQAGTTLRIVHDNKAGPGAKA